MGIAPLQIGDYPSPNFSPAHRQVGDVRGITVHDTESTSASALAWLTNLASEVSAHYLISEAGAIYRLVQEPDVAYHCAAWGNDPSLNRNKPDWLPAKSSGSYSRVNSSTVGIELAGFAARGYPAIQYQALGLLCAQVCRAWHLPPTLLPDHGAAARIVTHGWLQTNRSDPGPRFDWAQFGTWLAHYYGEDDDMATNAELQAQLDQCNGINTELQSQVDALRTEVDHLNGVNTQLNLQWTNCETLKQQVESELRAEIDRLNAELAAAGSGTLPRYVEVTTTDGVVHAFVPDVGV